MPLTPSTTAPATTAAFERLVQGCPCCGTAVSVPSNTPKYRCLACETTIQACEDPQGKADAEKLPEGAQPDLISYTGLQHCIAQCTKAPGNTPADTFRPLETLLSRQFGAREVFDRSFTTALRLRHHDPNLNREELAQYFTLLTRLPTRRPLFRVLTAILERLRHPPRTLDTLFVRFLVAVLGIPFIAHGLIHTNSHTRPPTSMLDALEIRAQTYELTKRAVGFLAQLPPNLVAYLVPWFRNTTNEGFLRTVEVVNLYLTFLLNRYLLSAPVPVSGPPSEYTDYATAKETAAHGSPALVSVSLGLFGKKVPVEVGRIRIAQYTNDWRVGAAAKTLQFLFMASQGRKCPNSAFYNSLVDYVNLRQDFDGWQQGRHHAQRSGPPAITLNNDLSIGAPVVSDILSMVRYLHSSISGGQAVRATFVRFAFCQFPFLVSLGGKISILEYEARRTMERKAEEAFIASLDTKRVNDVYFRVRVRRSHLVADSLRCIQENKANFKKGLRVEFTGEPGIDVGGLRKEWFLLMSKALFNVDNGMFTASPESHALWFSLAPLENTEAYYLCGVVLGLALYNSTILDLSHFPVALFRVITGKALGWADYADMYPETANGLRSLLSYNGNVVDLCLSFEVTYRDAFGQVCSTPLVPNGADIAVTNDNRAEYVRQYTTYFLETGVRALLTAFRCGFDNVTAGNAVSLFSTPEIQLLLCGSTEGSLDVKVLRSVTKYAGWGSVEKAVTANLTGWFWEYFEEMEYAEQMQLLRFVTGSDRVPATGVHTMAFKLVRLSGSPKRLPIAHTCFNELCLYEYPSKEILCTKLHIAMTESAGFGLK